MSQQRTRLSKLVRDARGNGKKGKFAGGKWSRSAARSGLRCGCSRSRPPAHGRPAPRRCPITTAMPGPRRRQRCRPLLARLFSPLTRRRARARSPPRPARDPQALTRGRGGRGTACFSPVPPVAGPQGARGLGSSVLLQSSGAWCDACAAAHAPGRRAFALASLRGGASADGMEARIGPLKAKRLIPAAKYRPRACYAPCPPAPRSRCPCRGAGLRACSARLISGHAQASREELGGCRGI